MIVTLIKKTRKIGSLGLLVIAFACLFVFLCAFAPNFFSYGNFSNVLRQVSMIAIMAVGMTMVILTGEIDLSIGSLVAFSGTVFAWLMVKAGFNWIPALLLTLAIGAVVGLVIGFIQTKFHVPSFIITLGLFQALRSASFVITNAFPIAPLPNEINWIGRGMLGIVPIPIVFMAFAYVAGYFLLNHTTWGRAIYAVGSNITAAELSGLNTKIIKVSAFVVNSFLAAFAGIILASRLNSGTPTVASGWELDVIAAVIIGGTAMTGGAGNILGTLFGALFVAVLNNGMVLMGVSPYIQGIISGLVIIAAVLAGSKRQGQ